MLGKFIEKNSLNKTQGYFKGTMWLILLTIPRVCTVCKKIGK